jgi:hypothetical protein
MIADTLLLFILGMCVQLFHPVFLKSFSSSGFIRLHTYLHLRASCTGQTDGPYRILYIHKSNVA